VQKISKYKTAMTYASAWLDAAKDEKQEDAVFQEICVLKESLKEHAAVWAVLSQPVDDNSQKIQIIEALAKEIHLSRISTQTLKLILENDRLSLLALIFHAFKEAYYKDKGIIEVTVDTAVLLTEAQNKKLQKTLENKLQMPVMINYQIKPEVLGGLAVRYDSFLIDDTLAGKLKHLKKIITHSKIDSNRVIE